MFPRRGERRNTVPGSKNKVHNSTSTALPPKNYITIKDNNEVQVPNLINIYRHEYKSKHFQFGTTLSTEAYQHELTQTTEHCNKMIKELKMTEEDLRWIGDEIGYQATWPLQTKIFRIAQLNVNGLSFTKDNYKIDLFLQGLMAM